MSLTCDSDKKNLGLSKCNKLPSLPKTMFTTGDDFVIPEATAGDPVALEAFLQDALLEKEIYLWPDFVNFTDQSQEATYQDTALSYVKVKDGNYRFLFGISENLCLHKNMYSHRARQGRVLIVDVENQILGTQDSNGDVRGLKIQMLDTQKLKFNDGSVATESPILVALKDNLEVDKSGVLMDGSFVGTLNRVTDVDIVVVSSIATKVIVTVKTECDQTEVSGLVVADFTLLTAGGAAQTITSVTEPSPGRYELNGTGLVTGTVNIKAPDVLTIEAYESTGAKTVTIA